MATSKIQGLDAAIAEARALALHEEIDDILLSREAARRGISVGRLIYDEVILKTPHPTAAEVQSEITAHPTTYKKPAEDAEWAAGNIVERRLAQRQKEFTATLEKQSPVKHTPIARPTAEMDVRIER